MFVPIQHYIAWLYAFENWNVCDAAAVTHSIFVRILSMFFWYDNIENNKFKVTNLVLGLVIIGKNDKFKLVTPKRQGQILLCAGRMH